MAPIPPSCHLFAEQIEFRQCCFEAENQRSVLSVFERQIIGHDRTERLCKCLFHEGFASKMSGARRLMTRLVSLIVAAPSVEQLRGQIEMLIWKLPPSKTIAGSHQLRIRTIFERSLPLSSEFSHFFFVSFRRSFAFDFAFPQCYCVTRWFCCGSAKVSLRLNSSSIRRLERSFRNNNSIAAGPSHTKEAGYREPIRKWASPQKRE